MHYVQLWWQAKIFGVRGLQELVVEETRNTLFDITYPQVPSEVPDGLFNAIEAYYSRDTEVGSALGKEFVKGLLTMGHCEYTTDDDRLRCWIVEQPILGAYIACHYLKRGIRYKASSKKDPLWEIQYSSRVKNA
jgi:hypothetical protein